MRLGFILCDNYDNYNLHNFTYLFALLSSRRASRSALSDWTECIRENEFNMLPANITYASKKKASLIKLISECSYDLEATKEKRDFISNPITWNLSKNYYY